MRKMERNRINSEGTKQREQEVGSEIKEFHVEDISVKWQLLSRAFTAVLGKADWQRQICPYTYRLTCQFVHVQADLEFSLHFPSGTSR